MAIFKRGKFYWYEFVFNGARIQRSTKQGNRKAAIDIESAYRTSLAKGEVGIEESKRARLTIGELLDRLEQDYKLRGKWTPQSKSNVARVRQDFGNIQSDRLTPDAIERYIAKCLQEKDANATINRRTELLRRAYKVARLQAPEMRHLSEKDNVRRGFFTPAEFELVESNLPADLRDFARFAFLTGWRKGEVASLQWADIHNDTIFLRAANSKNRESRSIPICGELVALIDRRKEARPFESGQGTVISNLVFHRDGLPIKEFRKAWASACKKAGVSRLFHDLRRSAVKNLVDAGVNQKTAMEISGHKTDAMFRRYHIVSQKDKGTALELVQQHNHHNVVSIAKG